MPTHHPRNTSRRTIFPGVGITALESQLGYGLRKFAFVKEHSEVINDSFVLVISLIIHYHLNFEFHSLLL